MSQKSDLTLTQDERRFTFAFQPIVDAGTRSILSYEALVRGPNCEGAQLVLEAVASDDLPAFDSDCRRAAIGLATRLEIGCDLNLNLVPQSFQHDQDFLGPTLQAARESEFPLTRIVLEITENGILGNTQRFVERMNEYRGLGLKLALDDFGSGYSGLNLLSEFQPDQLKLDRHLVSGIQSRGPRQAIVRAIVQVCRDLGIDLIAEGVETPDEYQWLCNEDVHLFQGYLFARPAFELLPVAEFPASTSPDWPRTAPTPQQPNAITTSSRSKPAAAERPN